MTAGNADNANNTAGRRIGGIYVVRTAPNDIASGATDSTVAIPGGTVLVGVIAAPPRMEDPRRKLAPRPEILSDWLRSRSVDAARTAPGLGFRRGKNR